MSEAAITSPAWDTDRRDVGGADWLCFTATPCFAFMALLTAAQSGGPANVLCSAAREASPFGGMVAMYVLMSAFHASPWVKLIFRRAARP